MKLWDFMSIPIGWLWNWAIASFHFLCTKKWQNKTIELSNVFAQFPRVMWYHNKVIQIANPIDWCAASSTASSRWEHELREQLGLWVFLSVLLTVCRFGYWNIPHILAPLRLELKTLRFRARCSTTGTTNVSSIWLQHLVCDKHILYVATRSSVWL